MTQIYPLTTPVRMSALIAAHAYKGIVGSVIASRLTATGEAEYQVEFPRRTYSPEELEQAEAMNTHQDLDVMEQENIIWLLAREVEEASEN